MANPVILVVDSDPVGLATIERELLDRYDRHYAVVCVGSATDARRRLAELQVEGEAVTLVLAGQELGDTTGGELLAEVRQLHPHAKRALLVGWGEWGFRATGDAILEAIEHGRIDHYVVRPVAPPDELFHHSISTFLLEWAEERRTAPYAIQVVGDSWSGRAAQLRDVLERCAFPHAFCLADSDEGQKLLGETPADSELPVVILPDGTTLTNPSDVELTRATGSSVEPEDEEIDLLIVGAGPAGLSAGVYGASEGLRTLVVDTHGIGGQARSSSLIRNYLGFPRGVSGAVLARQAYEQAWVFGARFVFMQDVTRSAQERRRPARRDAVQRDNRLGARGRPRHRGRVPPPRNSRSRGPRRRGRLLRRRGIRRSSHGGPGRLRGRRCELRRTGSAPHGAVRAPPHARRAGAVTRGRDVALPRPAARGDAERRDQGGNRDRRWRGRRLAHAPRPARPGERAEETVPADGLYPSIGARPHTEWLPAEIARDERGFVLTGADVPRDAWPLERDPFPLETSMPRVLAVGDARHGSVKRVASAVGAGSIAIRVVHRLLEADDASAPVDELGELRPA